MNYRDSELLERLAAEYALGTLRGGARQRFERLLPEHPPALAAVQRWEDRLSDLALELAPVEPRAATWRAIRKRLGHEESRWSSFFAWWTTTRIALVAVIAAVAFAVMLEVSIETPSTRVLANITSEQNDRWWSIEAIGENEQLRVVASTAVTVDTTRAYELWALPDSGAAPVSLGLMPQGGVRELALSAAQRAALQAASKVAVSLEAPGGSTTGAPGQVLFVADVIRTG